MEGCMATRVEEHKKEDSPVGNYIRLCGKEATSAELKGGIIDRSNNAVKILTLKALHIRKLRPRINTQDEFSCRELTPRF